MTQEEIQLIKKAFKGQHRATQALYQYYKSYWFRICLRYGRNKSEAQDIFQEGVEKIFQHLKKFDLKKGHFKNWSARVLINAALQYLRKFQWQQSFEDLELAEMETDWNAQIYDQITAKELTELIQQLPSGYRMVFNMFEIEGYSHREIAELLNIAVSTSKSQLYKAKKLLQQKIIVLFR